MQSKSNPYNDARCTPNQPTPYNSWRLVPCVRHITFVLCHILSLRRHSAWLSVHMEQHVHLMYKVKFAICSKQEGALLVKAEGCDADCSRCYIVYCVYLFQLFVEIRVGVQ